MAALDLGTLHREQGRRDAAEAAFRQVLRFDNPDCTSLAQAALTDLGSGPLLPTSTARPTRGPGQSGYAVAPSQTQTRPGGTPPPNHLTFAVISLVLGIWLLGIPAVLNASRVDSLWAAGDVAGAHLASGKAHKFATWSLAVCAVVVLGYVVLFALVGVETTTGH